MRRGAPGRLACLGVLAAARLAPRRWDDRRERAVGERPCGDGVVLTGAARPGARAFGRRRSRSAASSSRSACRRSFAKTACAPASRRSGSRASARRSWPGLVLREAPRRAGRAGRRRSDPDSATGAIWSHGARQRADRRAADVRRRLHRRLPARQPRRVSGRGRRGAREHAGCSGSRAASQPAGGPTSSRAGSRRFVRSRSSPPASTLLTAVAVGAPLVVLVPLLVAAGALAMSWNSLAFAAAAEVVRHERRAGSAIGLQQTRAERSRAPPTRRSSGRS